MSSRLVRYSTEIPKWTEEGLKKVYRESRNIPRMHGVHHSRVHIDSMYTKRENGRRGLISMKNLLRIELESLMRYLAQSKEAMLVIVTNERVLKADNIESRQKEGNTKEVPEGHEQE